MSTNIFIFFGLFYIRQFVNLESLILIGNTEQDFNEVITKLNLLSKLSYLSIKLVHGLLPKITVPSLKYLSISMYQPEQLLLCTPILINLNVQLIAETTSVDNSFLSTKITTEICQLKIEPVEKSNIVFDDIKFSKRNFSIDYHYDTETAKHYYFPNLDSLTIHNLHKLIPIDNFINLSKIEHLTVKQNNTIYSEEFFSYIYILVHSTKLQSLKSS
ncbi:unnamed protein product [Rotaria sordida]|uniref:Uncharacterized protein n=1 Tax=Rotaria sordida TaxID=392033 RepID=A0A819MWR6_9BILA|nr:unnamed protein product [Rotaria sordida]